MFYNVFNHFFIQHRYFKIISIIILILFGINLLFIGITFAYQKSYNDKIYNGVYLGQYNLGGMTQSELINFIEKFNNRLAQEGVVLYYNDNKGIINIKIDTFTKRADNSIELVKLDSSYLANQAIKKGRGGNWLYNLITPLKLLVTKDELANKVVFKDEILKEIKTKLSSYEVNTVNANVFVSSTSPLHYTIVPEKSGSYFDYNQIKKDLIQKLSVLDLSSINIKQKNFIPTIRKKQVSLAINNLAKVLSYGNLSLNYIDPQTKIKKEWIIKIDTYSKWLEVIKDNQDNYVFGLKKSEVDKYIKSIKSNIEKKPINAKFVINNNKVEQFQASQFGITIDFNKTYLNLNKAFQERNYNPSEITKSITVSIAITEPAIKMADANNLGISDILGAGVSSYKYSHTNRIKNIANAVKKLNGVIIQPGEIFSTNKYAGPYTAGNGYLPEEVIVGDLIKIEIGGGMCQIGTTMFRTAMNAGMPITERTNHSLIVQYYADPVNGNPGTDATLYDPYLDFKFKNNTNNYMLLQTEMNPSNMELKFTLWGKDDGRKGSYTHPVVKQRYYPGEKVYRESNELKPGQEKCQNAFTGASASFTYTIITSSSKKIDRIFDSYYRPQPQICMVGPNLEDYCSDNINDELCKNVKNTSSTKNL